MPLINSSALVVGVTHAEDIPWDLHERLSEHVVNKGVTANVILVDARKREDMLELVKSLIYMIVSGF